MRIGFGYDLHRLVAGRPLMLGGVNIPSPLGEEAHSDGDVLLHALIDALLGAVAEGDIGTHFPPSDPQWKDIDSLILLEKTLEIIDSHDYKIENIDCTIILEKPRLLPHMETIRTSLSQALHIPLNSVSVKAKTKEKVDAVGEGRAIEAHAALLLTNG